MENEIYKKIIGYEKLIEIFGYWPSFHDAEVINISLDRLGKDEWEGPNVCTKVHVFQMGPEKTKDGKNFIFHHHSIITFRFLNSENINIDSFNHQNAIDGLVVNEKFSKEKKKNIFEVRFEPAYGVGCSIDCERIEILDIEKTIPKYSVYNKNT